MTEVVAAFFEKEGAVLLFQRPKNKARSGLYEFVGGKVEPGESHEAALIRECREELGVTVSVGKLVFDVVHDYPDLSIHLYLYSAGITEGPIRLLEHDRMQWIKLDQMEKYPICPADLEILNALKASLL